MKHVAIHAYPFGNVGDDLFIRTLCERYPHVHFHLMIKMEYASALKNIPNLSLHPLDAIGFRLRRFLHKDTAFPRELEEKVDGTVYIGGSIFMEQDGWEQSFTRLQQMQQSGKPFFIIGANFGPFHSDTFLHTYETFFKRVEAIRFRDYFSYNLFSHLKNVRYAPDVIFNLYETFHPANVLEEKNVLISVIYPSERNDLTFVDERYFSSITHLINEAVRQEYTITLTAFCPYERDDDATCEIVQRLSSDVRTHVDIHIYDGDIARVYQLFQQATFVVATRFHAMILGWLFEKKVFPITYSEKMNHVLRDLTYRGDFQDIQQMEVDIVERVFSMEDPMIDLHTLAKEAEHHFSALDKWLPRK